MPNLTRAEGNKFIEALNERALCACAVRKQLLQMGVQGPYLDCSFHKHDTFGPQDGKCIHPGIFATEREAEYCPMCNTFVPRREL
jgi:hypothetical protein